MAPEAELRLLGRNSLGEDATVAGLVVGSLSQVGAQRPHIHFRGNCGRHLCVWCAMASPTQQRPLTGSAFDVAQAVALPCLPLPWHTEGPVAFPSPTESPGPLFPVKEPCQLRCVLDTLVTHVGPASVSLSVKWA